MVTRMAAWRSRLEIVALVIVVARLVDFGGDVTSAIAWGFGSFGDWALRLTGYPMVLPGLALLVSLMILVVTRIVYSWPKGTPMRSALLAAMGGLVMGTVGVVCSVGAAVTQMARMGRAAEYSTTTPVFLAGTFYTLAGLIVYAGAVVLASWLLRELMRNRLPRPATEPESGPSAQI
jgi:hypothetical protein